MFCPSIFLSALLVRFGNFSKTQESRVGAYLPLTWFRLRQHSTKGRGPHGRPRRAQRRPIFLRLDELEAKLSKARRFDSF
jgi:hypothetical protein